MNIAKIAATLAIAAGLGAAGFALPQSASAQVPPPPFGRPHQERHPELRRALASLARTESDLRHADRDFGGHRLKAADLCHQAQMEIRKAIQFDRS